MLIYKKMSLKKRATFFINLQKPKLLRVKLTI